ncbi:MAG TPA: MraY family glycosyltransferase [Clostridiales bacterium]|nr:MraY family glycosyltransferase [Clostridiales bacterium]HPV02089.1 MraY family glycosyltransferase [Clostridiales bacterium]
MKYAAAFALAFICVYVLIPPLRKLALTIGFVDVPTERKIHTEPVPHLASIGIFTGFISAYLLFSGGAGRRDIGFMAGALMVLAIGIVDDWYKTHGKDFPALPKAAVQVAAAVTAYLSGFVFTGFTNPFDHGKYVMLPVWLQAVLTVTWIFGVITVINFSDGLDGLAGSLSTISAMTLFIVALAKGQTRSALMSIILVGVAVGYLKYNKPPARIYMGDAGAGFMGYVLAVIALDGAFKQATVLSLFVPILALGVPIFDNLFVVAKRLVDGKPFYKPDRSQVHYRLLSAGLSPKQVVMVLCLVNVCLCLTSIIILLLRV